jgi:hypothetical protein
LIDWIEQDSFYYYNAETITLDMLELCPTGTTSQRGVYVVGKSGGVETSTHNAVGVALDVYTGSTPTFYKKYTGTTSTATAKTFFPFGTGVSNTTIVSQINLAAITTPNPQNKITYITGSTTLCTSNCNMTLSVQTNNATNAGGTNGNARVTMSGGTSPYQVNIGVVSGNTLNIFSNATVTGTTSPFFENLSTGVTYGFRVQDATSCVKETTFTVGQSVFTFDADYMMITYQFTNGRDLDTRTRMAIPNIGQTSQLEYLGWGRKYQWTPSNAILLWGGDNTGTGYESVLINLNLFRQLYPNESQFVVDFRGFWYGTLGTNPVNVAATMWKGGTPTKSGFVWTNSTATATYNISSVSKAVTLQTQNAGTSGQRIATLTYNLVSNTGAFNNNDTTTPSV